MSFPDLLSNSLRRCFELSPGKLLLVSLLAWPIQMSPLSAEPVYDPLQDQEVCLQSQQSEVERRTACQRILREQPQHAEIWQALAKIQIEEAEYGQAIDSLDQALKFGSKTANVYFLRGLARYLKGAYGEDFKQIISDYTRALELDPSHALSHAYRALAYCDQVACPAYEPALAEINRAVELDASAFNLYHRGLLWLIWAQRDKARADFTRALALAPHSVQLYYHRAYTWPLPEENARALADYTAAIRLKPDMAHAYFERGLIRSRQGELSLAIADYSRAIELYPHDADLYLNHERAYLERADAYLLLKAYSEAEADYSQIVAMYLEDQQSRQNGAPVKARFPTAYRFHAYRGIAWAFALQGRFQLAQRELENLAEASEIIDWDLQGWIFFLQGRLPEAKAAFAKAAFAKDSPLVFYRESWLAWIRAWLPELTRPLKLTSEQAARLQQDLNLIGKNQSHQALESFYNHMLQAAEQ